MNIQETNGFLLWLGNFYPSVRLEIDPQTNLCIHTQQWALELAKFPKARVYAAAKDAMRESPSFFPPLPLIQNFLREQTTRIYSKTREEQFKDTHYGMTPDEYAAMERWHASPEYAAAVAKGLELAKKMKENRGI